MEQEEVEEEEEESGGGRDPPGVKDGRRGDGTKQGSGMMEVAIRAVVEMSRKYKAAINRLQILNLTIRLRRSILRTVCIVSH